VTAKPASRKQLPARKPAGPKAASADSRDLEIASLRKKVGILQQISHTIWGTLELDEVLKRIMETVGDITEADAVLLYLVDKATGDLTLRASSKPHPDLTGEFTLKFGVGITGWVARHKETVAIPRRAKEDPRFIRVEGLQEDAFEAFLSVPILRRGKLVGVVNAHHTKPLDWDKESIEMVSAIAQQVGGAIENALLYEDARTKALQIEMLSKVSESVVSDEYLDEILSLIVTMTAELMRSKICSLMLLNEERGELVVTATQSLSDEYRNKPPIKVGQSVSGLVLQEKKPIAIKNVQKDTRYAHPDVARKEGLVSLLSVPLMVKDKAWGVLNLYTTEERDFTSEEIRVIQTVTNQAAVAIQNTRLIRETLQMKEALETRKVIERAKGILMDELGLAEQKAFRLLQKKSMDSCRPMKEIAEALILSHEMRQEKTPKSK
jgi:GAF domain-containing protein